jgi:hypothetical protein
LGSKPDLDQLASGLNRSDTKAPGHVGTREERLQKFLLQNDAKVADVRRTANVYKTNMQQWRRGELNDSSVMSERIEDVLRGKVALKRGKKKG